MQGKRITVVGLLVAVAATMAMAFSASSASACTSNILCSGATGPKIRDDAEEPPTGGGYGAAVLATDNTAAIRLLVKKESTVVAENSTPKGYAFFGIQIGSNPTSSSCEAGHESATGWVTFADLSHSTPSAIYSGISPGKFGAWPIRIRSDSCKTNPGQVTIENVHLYYPTLSSSLSGNFTGTYTQPSGGVCTGGGVKLNKAQPGINVGTGLTAEWDNGAGGEAAICFVSSNNVLFPTTAPTWTPLTGSIWKD